MPFWVHSARQSRAAACCVGHLNSARRPPFARLHLDLRAFEWAVLGRSCPRAPGCGSKRGFPLRERPQRSPRWVTATTARTAEASVSRACVSALHALDARPKQASRAVAGRAAACRTSARRREGKGAVASARVLDLTRRRDAEALPLAPVDLGLGDHLDASVISMVSVGATPGGRGPEPKRSEAVPENSTAEQVVVAWL